MRFRNAVAALIATILAANVLVLALTELNRRYHLRPGLLAAVTLLYGLIVVVTVAALASARDPAANEEGWHYQDVTRLTGASLGLLLLLFWLLVWLEETRGLDRGVTMGVLVFVGIVTWILSVMMLATAVRPRRVGKARPPSAGAWIGSLGPAFIFWLSLSYLAVLLGLAVGFNFLADTVKDDIGMIGNILPIGVPWFGALGAVTISLYGVFRHNDEWQPKWNAWHVARPLVGAVLGMIAFFIIFGVSEATTPSSGTVATQTTDGSESGGAGVADAQTQQQVGQDDQGGTDQTDGQLPPEGLILYYIVAFVAGYREDSFRDLIRRTADVLLKPGGFGDEGTVDLLPAGPVSYGTVLPGETSAFVDFQITNRTGKTLTIPADGVAFLGERADHWTWEQGDDDSRTWWDGTLALVADKATLWIRTMWGPPEDGAAGEQESTTLSISYTGVEGPAKTARLFGTVAEEEE